MIIRWTQLGTICKYSHTLDGRANEVDDKMGEKLKEKCLERRVIGDRCDRYGRSGVRGIRSGKAKPTKLGSAWTTRRVPPKVPTGFHRTWRKPRLWLLYLQLIQGFQAETILHHIPCNLVFKFGTSTSPVQLPLRLIWNHQFLSIYRANTSTLFLAVLSFWICW